MSNNEKILGISGSPIPDSNTDRAVRHILASSGLDHEFVKLSKLHLEPCRACLGCVKDNECVIDDDGRRLAEQFRDAAGFVLGAFTPYSSLDARTKAFMERMYCFRHRTGGNRGKPGVAVITTAFPAETDDLPPAAETAGAQIQFWALEEGLDLLGTMVLVGNVPCIRCGHGDSCAVSGIRMVHGPVASVDSVGVQRFEDQAALLDQATELGRKLAGAVRGSKEPTT